MAELALQALLLMLWVVVWGPYVVMRLLGWV
jgi:hypothetical protein